MIATALLIVCCSPLTTALPTEPPAQAAPRAVAPDLAWNSPLGQLRKASLVAVGTVGDLLLAEDDRGGLTSLDPATGEAHWFVQLPARLSAWPVPGDGKLALACGADVLVVKSATGSRVLSIGSTSIPANSPTADDKVAYVPTLLHDRVVATDLDTGMQCWEYQMAAAITTPAQLIGPPGTRSVLVGCADGVLRALPTGRSVPERERWVARVGPILDRPILSGGSVYVATTDRALHALDDASGAIEWTYLPGEALKGVPVIVGSVAVVGTGTRMLGVNLKDGKLAWEQKTSSVPLAELDGGLLAAREDGGSEWRDANGGALLSVPMPGHVASSHGLLVQLRNGTDLVAWKLKR